MYNNHKYKIVKLRTPHHQPSRLTIKRIENIS